MQDAVVGRMTGLQATQSFLGEKPFSIHCNVSGSTYTHCSYSAVSLAYMDFVDDKMDLQADNGFSWLKGPTVPKAECKRLSRSGKHWWIELVLLSIHAGVSIQVNEGQHDKPSQGLHAKLQSPYP